jgi:hypothetical protein
VVHSERSVSTKRGYARSGNGRADTMLSGSGIYGVEGSRLLPNNRRYASYLLCGSLQRRRSRADHDGANGNAANVGKLATRRRPLYSLHCEIMNYMRRSNIHKDDRWERRPKRSSRIQFKDDVDARIRGSWFRFIFTLRKTPSVEGYPMSTTWN